MTRTEERLADALRASAARVRDERLCPLPELDPEPARGTARRGQAAGAWRGWLVPAAAAVSVALVIGLAVTLTGVPSRVAGAPQGGRSGPIIGATSIPRYSVQVTGPNPAATTVEIRSVWAGALVASAPSPRSAGWAVAPSAAAAAPGGRTFYVAYDAERPKDAGQLWIYRLSTSSPRLTRINGGVIPQSATAGLRASMAVSPDGTKLVLTVASPLHVSGSGSGPGTRDKIVVVDLRTGARSEWAGGLDRSGRTLLIPDVSWTPDGRSVVFLALWCNPAVALSLCAEAFVPTVQRAEQVRSIPVTDSGGLLSRGSVLLSQRGSGGGTVPVIAGVVGGPRPGELTLAVLSGRKTMAGTWPVTTVERVAARTGRVLATDYRLAERTARAAGLSADPGGQHLLLTIGTQRGYLTGWIHDGNIRLLPLRQQPYSGYPVIAW